MTALLPVCRQTAFSKQTIVGQQINSGVMKVQVQRNNGNRLLAAMAKEASKRFVGKGE